MIKRYYSKIKDKLYSVDWTMVARVVLAVSSVIILTLYAVDLWTERNEKKEAFEKFNSEQTAEEFFDEAYGTVFVHIKGEVNNPGVYELEPSMRVSEAIEKAGGFTENADEDSVNLAEKVKDEMEIDVKSKIKSYNNSNYTNSYKSNYSSGKSSKSYSKNYSAPKQETATEPVPETKITVNINYASAGDLMAAGFSASQASAIIEYREYKGAFGSVSELLRVNGISQGTLSSLSANLTV